MQLINTIRQAPFEYHLYATDGKVSEIRAYMRVSDAQIDALYSLYNRQKIQALLSIIAPKLQYELAND